MYILGIINIFYLFVCSYTITVPCILSDVNSCPSSQIVDPGS